MKKMAVAAAVMMMTALVVAEDWRATADQRIREHRTVACTLTLRDGDGQPLPAGTPVRVRMTRHAFNFGTNMKRQFFAAPGKPRDKYTEEVRRIPRLFNTVVMGNGHKWGFWVNPEDRLGTDLAVVWAKEQGLRLRGHAMVWGVLKYKTTIPEPWRTYIAKKQTGHEDELQAAILAHIDEIGVALPQIIAWDVVNEPFSEQHIFKYLGADSPAEQADLIATWLARAHAAAPQAKLAINEFGIITDPGGGKAKKYLELLKTLVDKPAPLHHAGLQGHHWSAKQRPQPARLRAFFDRIAELGLGIEVTEWDTTYKVGGDRAATETAQAEHLEQVLMQLYAHPAGRSFVMWGCYDGRHWRNNAALFRKDWSGKPALAVWKRLVLGKWRTDARTEVADDGTVALRAHFGEYRVEAGVDGEAHHADLNIDADTAAAEVTLIETPSAGSPGHGEF